jgi:hypothetical protein
MPLQPWTLKRVVLRFLLYLGLAFGSLAILTLFFWLIVVRLHLQIPQIWWVLATGTGYVFWVVIQTKRRLWPQWWFWFAVAVLLAAHVAAFCIVITLLHVSRFPIIWAIAIGTLELVPVTVLLDWLVPETPEHKRENSAIP